MNHCRENFIELYFVTKALNKYILDKINILNRLNYF